MIFIFVVLGIITFAVLLYVFVLTRPRKQSPYTKLLLCDYAHRGLHGNGIPENSLMAFEEACRNGYGIELDVQLSKDGIATVFHDYSLNRMTGIDKKLSELDFSQLHTLSLAESEEKIPSLEEVLNLVSGRVPLLVELKGENINTAISKKVADLLKSYKGDYCIESFNPFLIRETKKHLPNAFYGQLYSNTCRDKKSRRFIDVLFTGMALNFISRPDFISFNKLDRDSFVVKLVTNLYKTPKFVWTTNGKSEIDIAHKNEEHAIFEMQ